MSKLVQALEADGLVVRKAVAGDKRAVRLYGYGQGTPCAPAGRQLRVATLAELMSGVEAETISVSCLGPRRCSKDLAAR